MIAPRLPQIAIAVLALATLLIGCKQDPPALEPAAGAQPVAIHQPAPAEPAGSNLTAPSPGGVTANTLPPGHPPVGNDAPRPTQGPQPGQTIRGTVTQTIAAGKYLYLELDRPEGTAWAAVLKEDVREGQTVEVESAHLMKRFRSPSLNRTFDEIWFGTLGKRSVEVAKVAVPTLKPESTPAIATAAKETSVATVNDTKTALAGKTVTISGKVVKFNAQIMGRNWIHLQDGSGSKEAGNHDLLVTGGFTAKVGDTITVQGTVAIDRDFGHGYSYDVLLEKATVKGAAAPE